VVLPDANHAHRAPAFLSRRRIPCAHLTRLSSERTGAIDTYGQLCTEYYDIDKPAAPPDALAFYLDHARRAGGPVLEPMCGTGRFLVPMREAGLDIDGVDASPQMLQACRAKCADLGLDVDLREGLFEDLSLPRLYAHAFIPAGSFSLLSIDSARTALERLHACLLPDATLLIDVLTGTEYRPGRSRWMGSWVERADGARIVRTILGNYEPTTRTLAMLNKYELFDGGQLVRTELEELAQQFYSLAEFTDLAETAGFSAEDVVEDFTGALATDAAVSLQVRCRRA